MLSDIEEIAKLAQNYVSRQPVVILGSGASIPYGLPSMDELEFEISQSIEFETYSEEYPIWEEFKDVLKETQDLENALNAVTLTPIMLEKVLEVTWRFITRRDFVFLRSLITGYREFQLPNLFKFLTRVANPNLLVITTNYDRLAEYASDLSGAETITGFTDGLLRRFDPSRLYQGRITSDKARISIYKVHGSLDWFEDQHGEPISIPLSFELLDALKPLIVTPGVTKYRETHNEPFRSIMSKADTALREASSYLCIGYGFNDEHVQPVLTQRINRDKIPIVCVSKTLSPSGRRLLLDNPCENFLIFEQAKNGTKIYLPSAPDGEIYKDLHLWELHEFLKLLEDD